MLVLANCTTKIAGTLLFKTNNHCQVISILNIVVIAYLIKILACKSINKFQNKNKDKMLKEYQIYVCIVIYERRRINNNSTKKEREEVRKSLTYTHVVFFF